MTIDKLSNDYYNKHIGLIGGFKKIVGNKVFKILLICNFISPLPAYCANNNSNIDKKTCEEEMGELKASLEQLPKIIDKIIDGKDITDNFYEIYIRIFYDKNYIKVVTLNKSESLIFKTYFGKLKNDYDKLVQRDGKADVNECIKIFKKTIPEGELKDLSINDLVKKIKEIFDNGEINFTFSVKKKKN